MPKSFRRTPWCACAGQRERRLCQYSQRARHSCSSSEIDPSQPLSPALHSSTPSSCFLLRSALRSVLILWGLAGTVPSVSLPAHAQARQIRPVQWEVLARIGPSDDLLLAPVRMTADSAAVYVYDGGDFRLKAFSWDGRLLWQAGRKGSGPGEFANPLSLSLTPSRELWVYDHANARIMRFNRQGALRGQIRFPHSMLPGAVLPLADGGFVAQTFLRSPFLVEFDSVGEERRRPAVPSELRGRDMLQARLLTTSQGNGRAVWASAYTDRIYVLLPATAEIVTVRGPVALEFPRTESATIRSGDGKRIAGVRPGASTRSAAVAVATTARWAYVLVGTAAPDPFRTIDIYDLQSASYVETILLPEPCLGFTLVGDVIVCLQHDPLPQIKLWRPARSRAGPVPGGSRP